MKRKSLSLILAILMMIAVLSGCAVSSGSDNPIAPEATAAIEADPVTLIVAGSWEDCRAIEAVGREFTAEYPNCTIVYEYLQDYYDSLEKRMSGEDAVDIFFTNNIQSKSPILPYAQDLNACEGLNLDDTFDGLIENFTFRENGAISNKLYAIPLGAEMRGLYINKTLLDSLGLEVPTDQATLLSACAALKEKGYIPFQGNPGDFAQTLLYPWICNLIANADDPEAAHAKVNARDPGVSEMFRPPFAFLYTLIENDYYNYKRAQTELNLFNETTDLDYARYFLNIRQNGDNWEKADDAGQVAFLPSPMSLRSVIEKTKEDYHSEIEYVFVPAPVGPEGGFAYLSPAHAIALNNSSDKLEWGVKFLDFLFQPKNNELFAEEFNVIPNTKEAFQYISTLYDVPDNRICHLGEVTFDYGFYDLVFESLLETSKANNPKYMQTAADGTTSLYPLDYYMNNLETSFITHE